MEQPSVVGGGVKVCLPHLGHISNIAATPIYSMVTALQKFGLTSMKLGMQHLGLGTTSIIAYSNDYPVLILTYFTEWYNLVT